MFRTRPLSIPWSVALVPSRTPTRPPRRRLVPVMSHALAGTSSRRTTAVQGPRPRPNRRLPLTRTGIRPPSPKPALREAILNAIDAVHRRQIETPDLEPKIHVTFNSDGPTLTVADNGVGMSSSEVSVLFAKVGASAATREAKKTSVGEFGIGVISYFMAGDSFDLQTCDGTSDPIGLSFDRNMLSGGAAALLPPSQSTQGTTITLHVHNDKFDLLLDSFPHWCRDVEGLSAEVLPACRPLAQHDAARPGASLTVTLPTWIQRAHLGPVSDPPGWDAMTGTSTVAVLYRGVFVQEFEIRGFWGIEGSIDVDPDHFKPRLNREGFVAGQFQTDVSDFLRSCHPVILEAMVEPLILSFTKGALDKWTVKRWANLWLSLPRSTDYAQTARKWDSVFRKLPAFELAVGHQWKPVSVEELTKLQPNDDGKILSRPSLMSEPTTWCRLHCGFFEIPAVRSSAAFVATRRGCATPDHHLPLRPI